AQVLLEKSADFALKSPPPGAAVASSDSAIIDALADLASGVAKGGAGAGGAISIIDLARATLEGFFGPLDLLDLGFCNTRIE
ncbi:MAG: hypothetical protein Q8M76_10250, partial [Spirochaetaceae bacterium]|nr:hypothetical protein [Spirochaetaceae bacterium]